ncbi:MAG: nuclear transport factor 2 family protein [Deltaproteobacteria bacterium]|nr:nuclear transport factor 2 family protein [Deltaproteobacteria bacterium]MBW2447021.1 nuclear transport factor 2 family protein [Deltaproteobacteria bacterium]
MADAAHIRQVYTRYPEMVSKGDVDGIVELYAEDATIEDPIGSDLHRGLDAVRAFYAESAGTVTMKQTGPVRVAGHEAATPLIVLMGPDGPGQKALDIISVMTFDEAGKVTNMRAFWSFDAIRPATADDR